MFVHRHSLGLYDILQWMEYFNTDRRQEKKKEKQNQLFLTPVWTIIPEEEILTSIIPPIYISITKYISLAFNSAWWTVSRFRRTYMLCFLSSCSWRWRFCCGCSRSSSTWLHVYWNSCRIMGSGLDGIIWRCCSRGRPFCKFAISWSCWNILELNRLCIYIMCSIMRCTSLRKKNMIILIDLSRYPIWTELWTFFWGGGASERWI